MSTPERLKPYNKKLEYSYASGTFVASELLIARPEQTRRIYTHSLFEDSTGLIKAFAGVGAEVMRDDRTFTRLGQKENSFVFAVFDKYECMISRERPHVVLVNPSDMGNLGSILRSMAAFGYTELAVIRPAADIFDPKTVRASMGAMFRINFQFFDDFVEYRAAFPEHACYPFMTDGAHELKVDSFRPAQLFAVIFGNEASGLPPAFHDIDGMGGSVKIPQTGLADSLNLSVAAGIGMFYFSNISNK